MKTHKELIDDSNREILEHLKKYRDRYPRHIRTPEQFIEYQNLINKFASDNAFEDGFQGD